MLIVIPKYVTRQIILNDFHYQKHDHHHHLQIPCQSVSVAARWHKTVLSCAFLKSVEADIQCYKIVLHATSPESTLFYGVHLVFTIRSQVSSLPPAKLSDDHPLRKLWQHDRISITGLDDWCRQKKTSLESHLLAQIVIPFKIPYLFQKCFKVSTEKYAFPTATKMILIFAIFIVSKFVFIHFRDSTYNFRILYLILDYIIDNLK